MILDYISPCGGGKLTVDDHAIIGGVETTSNENPILFLCHIKRRVHSFNIEPHLFVHAFNTRIGVGKYSRRPNDAKLIRQSHDNLIAWAWACASTNNKTIIRDIINFAKWRMYNYCLTKPWDYRCQLQGSHVFIMKLAAGIKPGWLSTLWYCGACIVKDHSADAYLKSMLETDIVHAKVSLLSKYKKRIVMWAVTLLEKRREGDDRWYNEYFQDPNHPCRVASKYKLGNII
jgi:hypothetical protein